MLNAESIKLRVLKLGECIKHLEGLQRHSLDEYLADPMVQGWTERLFQVGIECCMDIASHIIAAYGLERPVHRRDVFEVLGKAGYLEASFAAQLVEMGKLRNRLVHLYWDIDPHEMYNYLQNDVILLRRFRTFALAILDENRQEGKRVAS